MPERIPSSVDFPEPFGPIRPIRSPSETVKDTFWKSGLAPKAFEIPCTLRIGGKAAYSQYFSLLDGCFLRLSGKLYRSRRSRRGSLGLSCDSCVQDELRPARVYKGDPQTQGSGDHAG